MNDLILIEQEVRSSPRLHLKLVETMKYWQILLLHWKFLIWIHAEPQVRHHHDIDQRHIGDRSYRQAKKEIGATVALAAQNQENVGKVLRKLDTIEKTINGTISPPITDEQRENEQLIKLLSLPPDYNKFELPVIVRPGMIQPLSISVSLRIRNIRAVDVLNEEIGMELDLIVTWIDAGIRRHHQRSESVRRVLDSGFLKEIWWPNLIFSRTVSVVRPDLHGSFLIPRPVKLVINPRLGAIEMSSRLVLKIYCPMNFLYYPADTQDCKMRLRLYAKSVKHVELRWQTNSQGVPQVYFFNRGHPNYDIRMYNVTSDSYPECTKEPNSSTPSIRDVCPGSVHTYLEFSLSTRRKLSFHIMQTYVPSIFLVVITWLAFFIPIELLEARIGISMTILLTLTAMFGSIKEYTPPVSYRKAIDTWMFACIVFVFLTLFEFTLLMYLRHMHDKAQTKALESAVESTTKEKQIGDNAGDIYSSNLSLLREDHEKDVDKYYKVAKLYRITTSLVETYGFITVSIGFMIFNFIYWAWLLSYSNYRSFSVDFTHNEPLEYHNGIPIA